MSSKITITSNTLHTSKKKTPIKKETDYSKPASTPKKKKTTPLKTSNESPKSIMKDSSGKGKTGKSRVKWVEETKIKREPDEDEHMADYEMFEESNYSVVIKEEYDEDYRPHTKKDRSY